MPTTYATACASTIEGGIVDVAILVNPSAACTFLESTLATLQAVADLFPNLGAFKCSRHVADWRQLSGPVRANASHDDRSASVLTTRMALCVTRWGESRRTGGVRASFRAGSSRATLVKQRGLLFSGSRIGAKSFLATGRSARQNPLNQ